MSGGHFADDGVGFTRSHRSYLLFIFIFFFFLVLLLLLCFVLLEKFMFVRKVAPRGRKSRECLEMAVKERDARRKFSTWILEENAAKCV